MRDFAPPMRGSQAPDSASEQTPVDLINMVSGSMGHGDGPAQVERQ